MTSRTLCAPLGRSVANYYCGSCELSKIRRPKDGIFTAIDSVICKKEKSNKNSLTKKSRAYQKPGRVGFSLLSLLGSLPIRAVLLVILS